MLTRFTGASGSQRAHRQRTLSARQLQLELLERRELLTVTSLWDANTGELSFTLDGPNDTLRPKVDAAGIVVYGDESTTAPAAQVAKFVITGGSGDDKVDLSKLAAVDFPLLSSTEITVDVFVGGGDDNVQGSVFADRIHGEGGRDFISAGEGDDEIQGGDGEDFVFGGPGDDEIFGDEGLDNLHGEAGEDQVFGGPGADVVTGGDDDDMLFGANGAGTPLAADGNDTLIGGAGDDVLDGQIGDDLLQGDEGSDTNDDEYGHNVSLDIEQFNDGAGQSLQASNTAPIFEFVGNAKEGNLLSGGLPEVMTGDLFVLEIDTLDIDGDGVGVSIQTLDENGVPFPTFEETWDYVNSVVSFRMSSGSGGIQTVQVTADDGQDTTVTSIPVKVKVAPNMSAVRGPITTSDGYLTEYALGTTDEWIRYTGLLSDPMVYFPDLGVDLMDDRYVDISITLSDLADTEGVQFSIVDDGGAPVSISGNQMLVHATSAHAGKVYRVEYAATNEDNLTDTDSLVLDFPGAIAKCVAPVGHLHIPYISRPSALDDYHPVGYTSSPTLGGGGSGRTCGLHHTHTDYLRLEVQEGAHGSAAVNGFDVLYTPDPGYRGEDIVSYRVISLFTKTLIQPPHTVETIEIPSNWAQIHFTVNDYFPPQLISTEAVPGDFDDEHKCGCASIHISDTNGDASTRYSLGEDSELIYLPPQTEAVVTVQVAKGSFTTHSGRIEVGGAGYSFTFDQSTIDGPTGEFSLGVDTSNLSNGSHSYTVEMWDDPDAPSVVMGTIYVRGNRDIGLGPGWSVSGVDQLTQVHAGGAPDGSSLYSFILERGDGRVLHYQDPGATGVFTAHADETGAVLQLVSGGGFLLIDKEGNEYWFLPDGRIDRKVDRFGNTTIYEYLSGNIHKIRRQISGRVEEVSEFTYGTEARMVRERVDLAPDPNDPIQNTTPAEVKFEHFDNNGRLAWISRPVSNAVLTTKFDFSESGELTRVISPSGHITDAVRDPQGDVVTLTEKPIGGAAHSREIVVPTNVTRFKKAYTYDKPQPDVSSSQWTTVFGFTSTETFLPSPSQSVNRREGFRIEMDGERSMSNTDANGYESLSALEGTNATVTTNRDPDGNLQTRVESLELDDGSTAVTTYHYDAFQNLYQVDHPDQTTETWQFNDPDYAGLYTAYKDRENRWTYMERDVQPDGSEWVTTVRAVGSYDGPGVTTGDDVRMVEVLAADGRMLESWDGEGNITRYAYDPHHEWLASVTYGADTPDAGIVTYENYDMFGNAWEIDEFGRVTDYEYDDIGRLTKTTAPDPTTGLPTAPVAQDRAVTHHEYDSYGRLDRVIHTSDALFAYQMETKYHYDAAHRNRVSSITEDANNLGATTTYGFDELGRQTTLTDAEQRATQYLFDRLGRQVAMVLPDPDGPTGEQAAPASFTGYDARGNTIWMVDANRNPTRLSYDQENRLESSTTADGAVTTFDYYADGQQQEITDALGRVTYFEYDDLGRLHKTYLATPDPIDAAATLMSVATIYQYDKASNLRFVTDTEGRVTEYRYDARNRRNHVLAEAPDPNAPTVRPETEFSYNPDGQLESTTILVGYDTAGGRIERTTNFEYDGVGRLHKSILPPDINNERATTTQWYNEFGNVILAVDPEGNRTESDYDTLQRLESVIREHPTDNQSSSSDPDRPLTIFEYDLVGQLIEQREKAANGSEEITSYRYDDLGRLDRQVMPNPVDGAGTLPESPPAPGVPYSTFVYDAVGNRLSQSNADGETRTFEYAVHGGAYLMVADTNENNDVVRYTYDLLGRQQTLTDPPTTTNPDGNTTTWVYDDHGRVIEEHKDARARYFYYDSLGNLLSKTDARGLTTEYGRDHLNRITTEEWLDEEANILRTITFGYNLAGELTSASDPDHSYQYTYDAVGRQSFARHTVTGLVSQGWFGSYYNLDGTLADQEIMQVDWDVPVVEFERHYTYDNLNRLNSISQNATTGSVAELGVDFTYDLRSRFDLLTRYADQAMTTPVAVSDYDFDFNGRLMSLRHVEGDDLVTGGQIEKHSWEYTASNRIDEFYSYGDGTTDVRLADYGYDPSGQLTSATYTDYQAGQTDEDYQYDEAGNRIQSTLIANDLPQYVAHWEVEDGPAETTVEDMSGNQFDAVIGGTHTWISDIEEIAPIPGNQYSLELNGLSGHLNAGSAAALQIADHDFTVSTWMRADADDTHRMSLISHGNPQEAWGTGIEVEYWAQEVSKPLRVYLNNGSKKSQMLTYNTQGLHDDWHHVGVTIEQDGDITLYVDGLAARAVQNYKSGNIAPSGDFLIGAANDYAGGTTQHFGGMIDDVRVYSSALNANQMRDLSLSQSANWTSDYVIQDHNQLLRDGTYSYVYDAEGNRIKRIHLGNGGHDNYEWDHRNRLTQVRRFATREIVQFDFESGTGSVVLDAVGNAIPGAIQGDAEIVPKGTNGRAPDHALQLDGSGDFVTVGIQDLLQVGELGFSLSAWFKPEVSGGTHGIISYGDPDLGAGYAFYYDGTVGAETLVFELNDGAGGKQTVSHLIGADLTDTWKHVGVAVDPTGNIDLYYDTALAVSVTNQETSTFGEPSYAFHIGALPGGNAGFFEGEIDDVRVYGQPLDVPTYAISGGQVLIAPFVEKMRVDCAYDYLNQLISRSADADGAGAPLPTTSERYMYDRGQMVLRFDDAGEVSNRYLWGHGVDQLLADEQVSSATQPGDVIWALADNLGSVRDAVRYDDTTGTVEHVLHRTYDSFGNQTSHSSPIGADVDVIFGYTGRQFDELAGLQNNLNRWYDPIVGRWISEDPIGFVAGDANLYRYVGNSATNATDSSGLAEETRTVNATVTLAVLPPSVGQFGYRPSWQVGYQFIASLSNGSVSATDAVKTSDNILGQLDDFYIGAFDAGLGRRRYAEISSKTTPMGGNELHKEVTVQGWLEFTVGYTPELGGAEITTFGEGLNVTFRRKLPSVQHTYRIYCQSGKLQVEEIPGKRRWSSDDNRWTSIGSDGRIIGPQTRFRDYGRPEDLAPKLR